jgi:hypothetical protein
MDMGDFLRAAGVGLLVSCGQEPSLQPHPVDDGGGSSSPDGGGAGSADDASFASDATLAMNSDAAGGCSSNQSGCPCGTAGQTVACWTGPASERNVGACHDGTMTCARSGEFPAWGPCLGEQRICAQDGGVPPPHDSGPATDSEAGEPHADGGAETDGEGGEAEAGPPPQSCLPGSSLSALISGANVTTYIPVGSWTLAGTGVLVVPVEGTGFDGTGKPATIATPNVVNTCGGNSLTGEVVCTSNMTDVYLIKGTAITTTLTSAANTTENFSGGGCQTCNVAIDPSNNRAFLSIGYGDPDASPPSGAAFQPLDLVTGMLGMPIAADPGGTSEALLVDTVRGFVLSPNEKSNYQILNTATGQVFDFSFTLDAQSHLFDAPGEDCLTGIALAADEFTGNILLVDLTQATFSFSDAGSSDAGALRTWWAPNRIQSVPEFASFNAGTDGIAVAPSSHIGVVTGEFGGNAFGAFVLPSTSGGGTPPALVDWVAASIPDTPDQVPWSMGTDPHTLTAYASPTNGKPYAIFQDGATSTLADGASATLTYLAVVDLTALLARPRTTSDSSLPHTLATPLGASDTCIGSPGSLAPNPPGCIVRFIHL